MKKKPIIIVAVVTFLSAALAVLFMSTSSSEREDILASFNRTTASKSIGVSVTQTQQAVEKNKQELPESDSLLAGIQNPPPDADDSAYVPGTSGTTPHEGTLTAHGHVAFRQSEPPLNSVVLGKRKDGSRGTIGNNGCGLCAHTSLLNHFGYKTDPESLLNLLESWDPGMNERYWITPMDWNFPGYLVNVVNEHSDVFGFKLEMVKSLEGVNLSNEEFADTLTKYLLNSTDIAATASASEGIFTTGGHIICIPDMPDANSFHVVDSANTAGYANGIDYSQVHDYNWPLNSNDGAKRVVTWKPLYIEDCTLNNIGGYNIKCLWFFRKIPL